MSIGFLSFVLVTMIIVLIVLILALNKKDNNKKINKVQIQSENIKTNLKDIELPKNIEQMNAVVLSQACKVIIDSYKALDYANKLPSAMDKVEWHSWQLSMLLKFLKINGSLNLFDNKKMFHSSIINLSKISIEQDIQKIYKKYIDRVNIQRDRDTLSKDVIWTAREVSILLYKILENR